MMNQLASQGLAGFVSELFEPATPRRVGALWGWLLALGLHASAAGLAVTRAKPSLPERPPLSIELAAPDPPDPPALEPIPALPEPVPINARPAAPRVPRAPAPPEAARAGALLTAKADPQKTPDDSPVDFTNDPSALGFGSGVVAIGGRADAGRAHARPGVPAPGAGRVPAGRSPGGDALTPLADLGRKPSLAESDPCRGFFPPSATDDVASASVMVVIHKSGSVSSVRLLSESPAAQGFGAAARACMLGKHFNPALDRDGRPASTAVRVNLRFSR